VRRSGIRRTTGLSITDHNVQTRGNLWDMAVAMALAAMNYTLLIQLDPATASKPLVNCIVALKLGFGQLHVYVINKKCPGATP
jgi:hypothetical protein